MAPHVHHELCRAFLDVIETQDWARLDQICAPDLLIWHNVDREDKIFFDYLPFLIAVRASAAMWRYRETGYWEVGDRFFRQSLLDVQCVDGTVLNVATFIIGKVAEGRIKHIEEYYNAADIAPLQAMLDSTPSA